MSCLQVCFLSKSLNITIDLCCCYHMGFGLIRHVCDIPQLLYGGLHNRHNRYKITSFPVLNCLHVCSQVRLYTYLSALMRVSLDGLLGNLPSQTGKKKPSTMFVITASNSTQPKPYVAQQHKLMPSPCFSIDDIKTQRKSSGLYLR